MEAYAAAYAARVAEGLPFDGDLPVLEGHMHTAGEKVPRLALGAERFFITDINHPAGAATAQSSIPVMFGRWENHTPRGGNVLYMDGHVEFIKFGARWPMTEEAFAVLEGLDALGDVGGRIDPQITQINTDLGGDHGERGEGIISREGAKRGRGAGV